MVATVIITGNHYIVDCLASTALFGICCGLEAWRSRLRVGRSPLPPGFERRRSINLRPLDYPLTLGVVAATILLLSSEAFGRCCGLALLCLSVLALLLGRRLAAKGRILTPESPRAEWWCGLFFIAGSTAVYSSTPEAAAIAALLWATAVTLILASRMGLPLAGRAAGSRPA
jgi:hypothetical protein